VLSKFRGTFQIEARNLQRYPTIKRNNLFRASFESTSELENTKRHKMYGNQQLKPSAHAPSRPVRFGRVGFDFGDVFVQKLS
jgi:hypothetical protein